MNSIQSGNHNLGRLSIPNSALFISGKFEYIDEKKYDSYRFMFINAYDSITLTESWNYLRKMKDSELGGERLQII